MGKFKKKMGWALLFYFSRIYLLLVFVHKDSASLVFCIDVPFPNTVLWGNFHYSGMYNTIKLAFQAEQTLLRLDHQQNNGVKFFIVLRQRKKRERLLSLDAFIHLLILSIVTFWCVKNMEKGSCENIELSSDLYNISYAKIYQENSKTIFLEFGLD